MNAFKLLSRQVKRLAWVGHEHACRTTRNRERTPKHTLTKHLSPRCRCSRTRVSLLFEPSPALGFELRRSCRTGPWSGSTCRSYSSDGTWLSLTRLKLQHSQPAVVTAENGKLSLLLLFCVHQHFRRDMEGTLLNQTLLTCRGSFLPSGSRNWVMAKCCASGALEVLGWQQQGIRSGSCSNAASCCATCSTHQQSVCCVQRVVLIYDHTGKLYGEIHLAPREVPAVDPHQCCCLQLQVRDQKLSMKHSHARSNSFA
jgi:hypothetical protein